jgi:hypothetical protein
MVELSDTTPFLTFVGWLLRRFCYIFNDSNNISHFEWLELPDKRLVRLLMPILQRCCTDANELTILYCNTDTNSPKRSTDE